MKKWLILVLILILITPLSLSAPVQQASPVSSTSQIGKIESYWLVRLDFLTEYQSFFNRTNTSAIAACDSIGNCIGQYWDFGTNLCPEYVSFSLSFKGRMVNSPAVIGSCKEKKFFECDREVGCTKVLAVGNVACSSNGIITEVDPMTSNPIRAQGTSVKITFDAGGKKSFIAPGFTAERITKSELIPIQTLGQLNEKWKGKINFSVEEGKKELSPRMARFIDDYLERYPDAVQWINGIQFDDRANAAVLEYGKILLGEKIFQLSLIPLSSLRYFNPDEIIDHEVAHLRDFYIFEQDKISIGKLISAGSSTNAKFIRDAEEAAKKIDKNGYIGVSTIHQYLIRTPDKTFSKIEEDYFDKKYFLENYGYLEFGVKYWHINKQNLVDVDHKFIDDYLTGLEKEYLRYKTLREVWAYFGNQTKTLSSDSMAIKNTIEKYGDFIRNEVYQSKVNEEKIRLATEYIESQQKTKPLKELYEEIPNSKMNSLVFDSKLKSKYETLIDYISSDLSSKDPKVLSRAMLKLYGDLSKIKNIATFAERETSSFLQDLNSPQREYVISRLMRTSELVCITDLVSPEHLNSFYSFVLNDLGMPAPYTLKKEKMGITEISAVYAEEPLSLRKERANSDNANIRETYRKLTQLAFDSGKMDSKEYREIMGNVCKKSDCCDQKCKLYQLNCVGGCNA